MTKQKNTKRALLASVLSMMLCMAMLVGSTFAWFTDSVTSGKNRIVAGNLDIEVTHSNGKVTGQNIQGAENLFPVKLWEPGVVSYETFTVSNAGSLAFDYSFDFRAADYNTVVLADGAATELSLKDVIKIGVIEGEVAEGATREQLITAVKNIPGTDAAFGQTFTAFDNFSFTDYMQAAEKDGNPAKAEKTFTIVMYWEPGAADNDYNINNGKTVSKQNGGKDELFIDVTVNVFAKQRMYESDSFGNNYDENTIFPVKDAEELVKAISEGKSVVLANDIYLDGSYRRINVENTEATIDLAGNDLVLNDSTNNWKILFHISDGVMNIKNSSKEESTLRFVGKPGKTAPFWVETSTDSFVPRMEEILMNTPEEELEEALTKALEELSQTTERVGILNISNVNMVLDGARIYAGFGGVINIDDEANIEVCNGGCFYVDNYSVFNVNGGKIIIGEDSNCAIDNYQDMGFMMGFYTYFTPQINLNAGEIYAENAGASSVIQIRCDADITYTDVFEYNCALYKALGGYAHNISVNGVKQ